LWEETHDLPAIQDHLGHKSASSRLIYMRTDAAQKAQKAIRDMSRSRRLFAGNPAKIDDEHAETAAALASRISK
jgi:transposase